MLSDCVTLENSPPPSGTQFLTSKPEETPGPQHSYWQAFVRDVEKNVKTQLSYTTASCSFK